MKQFVSKVFHFIENQQVWSMGLGEEGIRKYLNAVEREILYNVMIADQKLRDKTFGLTIYYTGCRPTEARFLESAKVDYSNGTLGFETLKQREKGKYRHILVPNELLELLEEYIALYPDQKRIWPFSRTTGWRIVRDYMALASLEGKKACSRGLRHSYGTAYVSKDVPMDKIQKWMGHKNAKSTAIYTDVIGEEERRLASKIWG